MSDKVRADWTVDKSPYHEIHEWGPRTSFLACECKWRWPRICEDFQEVRAVLQALKGKREFARMSEVVNIEDPKMGHTPQIITTFNIESIEFRMRIQWNLDGWFFFTTTFSIGTPGRPSSSPKWCGSTRWFAGASCASLGTLGGQGASASKKGGDMGIDWDRLR